MNKQIEDEDLTCAYLLGKSEGYQQGKADGFQEALTSNGINIYVDKIESDGARKFAEWLPTHFDLRFSNNPDVWLDEFFNNTREKVLTEWQKEN